MQTVWWFSMQGVGLALRCGVKKPCCNAEARSAGVNDVSFAGMWEHEKPVTESMEM